MSEVDLWSFLYLDALVGPGLSSFWKAQMQMVGLVSFTLVKILKESLIYGNHEASPKQMSRQVAFKSKSGCHLGYANLVEVE